MIARQSTPTSLSHAYVDRIKDPLVVQLSDLRSSLVKDACHSIAHSVELAPMSFRPFGGFLVNAALQVVIKTTKVVKEAGDEMAQRIIRVLRAESSLVETICSSLSSGGHPVQREHSAKYLALVLSVPTPLQPLPPSPDSIDSSLLAALADPAAPVRTEARLAFKQYESNYAKQAEILFQRCVNHTRPPSHFPMPTSTRTNDALQLTPSPVNPATDTQAYTHTPTHPHSHTLSFSNRPGWTKASSAVFGQPRRNP